MLTKKQRILSASAVALLAVSGTSYGVGLAEDRADKDEAQDKQELLEQEDTSEKEEEITEEGDVSKEGEDGSAEVTGEESGEAELTVSQVDDTKVVPEEELPYYENSGLLDFAEYHKIAKGRALPRALTEEEEDYFEELVIDGVIVGGEDGETEKTEYVRIYPSSYYIDKEGHTLKWHSLTKIRSELYTLEEQEVYLSERKAEFDEKVELGFVYDEEIGDFISPIEDEDNDIKDPNEEDGVLGDQDYEENENPEYSYHYTDKEIYENLAEYDELSGTEFTGEYGSNFLYQGIIPKDEFDQREYELKDGLTLVLEVDNVSEGNNIVLTWAVVKDVVRFSEDTGTGNKGRYNLVTNDNQEDYIEDNVLGIGTQVLKDEGILTPHKIDIRYVDDEYVPNYYRLIASAVSDSEELPLFSSIVAYHEYNIPVEEMEGREPGNEEEDGTGGGIEDGTEEEDTEQEGETEDGKDQEEEGGTGGTGGTDTEDGTDGEEDDKDGADIGTEGKGEGSGGTDSGESTEGSSDGSKESETGKSEDTKEGRFLQTGANIIWGAIVSGLGLGAVGAYLKREEKEDSEEDSKEE